MWKIHFFCTLSIILTFRSISSHDISKRSLLFPRATVLQVTTGLSVPLILPRRSINFSICVQANYNLPYNITNFNLKTIQARRKETNFDVSRQTFYKYTINFLDSIGLNGEQCLLQAICEISQFPMYYADDHLLEKIIHFVFTPSLDIDSESNSTETEFNEFTEKLLDAEKYGRKNKYCNKEYSDCVLSLVDMFTEKYIM